MEKLKEEKQNQFSETKSSSYLGDRDLWDCGSTLFDSYELNSFKRQLNSAVANSPRSLSMSHLTECRLPRSLSQPQLQSQLRLPPVSKKSFKISRSLQKLLRYVFKSSSKSSISSTGSCSTSSFQVPEKYSKDRFYAVYDKSGPVLSTIPEVSEFEIGAHSPEIGSLVRRSASERFTASAMGISCT